MTLSFAEVPERLGDFRLIEPLGQGGMGAVYEGIDTMVERPVAIKMLRPEISGNPEILERFRVEAVTLAKLNHPSIATLYSFFHEENKYYMVMEFVPGETLESLVQRSGPMAPEQATGIVQQTLDGMAHAHAMGVLHRDIKPANIMVTPDGNVKVTDFGIAQVLGAARMTRQGSVVGTLEYLAPERIRGEEPDIRSDIYSAGIVLYEVLTGRLPFTATTDFEIMQSHLEKAPPSLESVGYKGTGSIVPILDKAIAKSKTERYQTAEEFRDALAEINPHAKSTSSVPATPVAKPTRLAVPETRIAENATTQQAVQPTRRQRSKMPFVLAGAAAVFLGLLTIIFLHLPNQPTQETVAPASPATNEPLEQKRTSIVVTGNTTPPVPKQVPVAALLPEDDDKEETNNSSQEKKTRTKDNRTQANEKGAKKAAANKGKVPSKTDPLNTAKAEAEIETAVSEPSPQPAAPAAPAPPPKPKSSIKDECMKCLCMACQKFCYRNRYISKAEAKQIQLRIRKTRDAAIASVRAEYSLPRRFVGEARRRTEAIDVAAERGCPIPKP